ncbi:alcohol dehydrogenase catalytic domain-containing protein [Streptomyces sp. N35]|uniref:zinc-dependent alcohol dehydrogenase n=1 Tax=Streptomyces sp. N35 TaxID=2795730 RepID=UPI0027DB80D7|nr:alcohol dehydrogenase catalytic domain-containing protein [Streptomyces sp. N35]
MTHEAVVLEGPGAWRLERPATEGPAAGEVRCRVDAAGICGSDRELFDGNRPEGYVRYPVTPGHEWAGTVEAVGAGVDPALVGRKVVAEGFRNCQTCERCRTGETSLCTAAYDETGFTRPGAFAAYVTVPARLLHLLDDAADLRAAALLEPAAVVASAVMKGAPRPAERIAVVGGGTLGLLAVQLLAAYTPGELVLIEPRRQRAEQGRQFGATGHLHPAEAEAQAGRFDLVVETAGVARSAALAVALTRRGGRVALTGIPAPGAQGVDPVALAMRQTTVYGVFGAPSAAWSYAVRAFGSGVLDPAPLITHELPLSAYDKAVALVGSGDPEVGKVLLRP